MFDVKIHPLDLRDLARRAGDVQTTVRPLLSKAVTDWGRNVETRARRNARWSKKIPPSIQADPARSVGSVAFTAKVHAGPDPVIAGLFERPAGWRHPLFGDRERWYGARPPMGSGAKRRQGPRRYLHPALEQERRDGEVLVRRQVTVGIRQAIRG